MSDPRGPSSVTSTGSYTPNNHSVRTLPSFPPSSLPVPFHLDFFQLIRLLLEILFLKGNLLRVQPAVSTRNLVKERGTHRFPTGLIISSEKNFRLLLGLLDYRSPTDDRCGKWTRRPDKNSHLDSSHKGRDGVRWGTLDT